MYPIPYAIVDGILFRRYLNTVLLMCINLDQTNRMMREFHDGLDGGHFLARTTTMKIMRVSYYWTTLFNESH